MTTFLALCAGLGGLAAVITLVTIAARGIVSQAAAIRDNTRALDGLTSRLGVIEHVVNRQETRISRLERADETGRAG